MSLHKAKSDKHMRADQAAGGLEAAALWRAASQPRSSGYLKKQIIAKSLRQAINYEQRNKQDHAAKIYERIVRLQPDHFEALTYLAVYHYRQNRVYEARDLLNVAAHYHPSQAMVWLNLAIINDQLGCHAEALEHSEKALALKSDYMEAYLTRGNALKGLRRLHDALESYDNALKLNPGYGEALNNRGVTLRELGRLEEAVAAYDAATAYNPDVAAYHNNQAAVLAELNRPKEALVHLQKAVELDPNYCEAYGNMGAALSALKRFDDALAAFDRALSLNPHHVETWSNRGNTLGELNRIEEALKNYAKATELNPGYADAYANLGVLLGEYGRLADAERACQRAITLNPNCARYSYLYGEAHHYTPDDPHMNVMLALAQNMQAMPLKEQTFLNFALAKAFSDLGDMERSFSYQLAGNALKRKQLGYNEAEIIGVQSQTASRFTPELIGSKAGQGDPSSAPIFIVGMPRSGSTLVEQILASHPHVASLGEVDNFGKTVLEFTGLGTTGLCYPNAVAALTAEHLREIGSSYMNRVRAEAPQALRITDKMLGNFLFAGLIHLALPHARIVHTRRDPIDTCLSCFSRLFVDCQPHTYDLAELGRYYRSYAKLMDHWRAVLPGSVMLDVQYEDVVFDLEAEARKIIAHCGLEWSPRCLDFHKTERRVRTASRTQVRQPLYKNSVNRRKWVEPHIQTLIEALQV